jgi:hypothetical protein
MNYLRNLWAGIKAFFSRIFGKKTRPVEVYESKDEAPKEVKVFDTTLAFEAAYNEAEEIEYKAEWNNGTGYYDHAAEGNHAPKLEVGQIVKAHSPYPNNRKLLIVGTELGNVVIFERYTAGAHGVYVWNAAAQFERAYGDKLERPLTAGNIRFILSLAKVPA